MSMRTLFTDELRGLSRSRVMIALWIGLPVLAVAMKLIQPNTDELPLLLFVGVLVGSIGGTLASVLLSTTVTSERNRHVYDLFLIRPVRRSMLLISKFLAALTALLIAAFLSFGIAVVVDALTGALAPGVIAEAARSLLISVAAMAIASSVGLLFGVLIDSVAVSAVLSVYLGNQLSAIIVLPAILVKGLNVTVFALLVGIAVPIVVMTAAILVFRRKSL